MSIVLGLTSTLSIKLMQDDLHIVKDLVLPVDDPKYLENLVEERCWGPSVLFVDNTDYMERNISIVTDQIKHYNIMPAYGENKLVNYSNNRGLILPNSKNRRKRAIPNFICSR